MTRLKLSMLAITAALSYGSVQGQTIFSTFSTTAPGTNHSSSEEDTYYKIPISVHYVYDYYFKLLHYSDLNVSANINTLSKDEADSGMVSLYEQTTNFLVGQFTYGTTSTSHLFNHVAPGSYYYEMTGMNDSTKPDQGTFLSSATAIPEPGINALLMAGLGVVSFVAARSRKIR